LAHSDQVSSDPVIRKAGTCTTSGGYWIVVSKTAQAWCAHDWLLHSQFMLKPFILDPSMPQIEKQFEHCKLTKLGFVSVEVGYYMWTGLHSKMLSKSVNDLKH